MKKSKWLILCFSSCFTIHAVAATQSYPELYRFELTNHCSGCDLSNATITANHSNAVLDNANLTNINSWERSVNFSGGIFTNTNFSNAYLIYVNFSNARLVSANLSGAFLSGANFTNANLTGAQFYGANVAYANFTGATDLDLTNVAVACNVVMPDGSQTPPC